METTNLDEIKDALATQWGNNGYKPFWDKISSNTDIMQIINDYIDDYMSADEIAEYLIDHEGELLYIVGDL